MIESDSRRLLGAFIRAHRERLPPPKTGGRRRTPGLRREELAEAAGLGVTWITWLEQGRQVSASVPALCRLAEALALTPAERASLFDLAGKRDPVRSQDEADELPAELLAMPSRFSAPAYLLDGSFTAIAWNEPAAELFVGWLDEGASSRNLLEYVLLADAARGLLVDRAERVRRLVAEFRADFNRRPTDARMQALVERLSGLSTEFAHWWQCQDVLNREGGERLFSHPVRGKLKFFQASFLLASHPEVKLSCLTPCLAPA